MAISDYDKTPANNTTISGIDIAEGCSPGNVNDAIRQMMADLASREESRATFEDFGAVGDAVLADDGTLSSGTDDTTAVQAAVTWMKADPGRVLDGQGKNYLITAEIAGVGHARIKDAHFVVNANARALDLEPTLYGPYDLGADYVLDALSINLTGDPLPVAPRPGMKMKIVSNANDPWNRDEGSATEAYRQGEWFTAGIGSTTTNIVLFRPLQFTRAVDPTSIPGEEPVVANGYTTAYGARVVYADPDAVCELENVTAQYIEGHDATPWTQPGLAVSGYHNASIRGCGVVRGYGPGIYLQGTVHARVDRPDVKNLTDNTAQGQFGYAIRNNGYGTIVDGLSAANVRHPYTSSVNSEQSGETNPKALLGVGRVQGEKIVNGHAYGGASAHWDTHHGTHGAIFDNIHSYNGADKSVSVRGRDILVKNHVSRNMRYGLQAFTGYSSGDPDDDFGPNEKSFLTATSAVFSDLNVECWSDPIYCSHAILQLGGSNNFTTRDHRALHCAGGNMTVLGRQTFVVTNADYSTDNTGIIHLTDVSSFMSAAFSQSHIIIGDGAEVTIDAKDATGVTGLYLFNGEAGTKVTVRGRLRVVLPQDAAGLFSGDVEVVCEGDGYIEYSVDNVADDSSIVALSELEGRNIDIRTVDRTLWYDSVHDGEFINAAPAKLRANWARDGAFHAVDFGVSRSNTGANNLTYMNDLLGEAGEVRTTSDIARVGQSTLVRLPDGIIKIDGTLLVQDNGVVFKGLAPNITALRQMDEAYDLVKFGAADAFNANNVSANSTLEGVGMQDLRLHLLGSDMTNARAARGLVLDRVQGHFSNLVIQGFNQGIAGLAAGRGNRLHDIHVIGNSGGTMSATPSDSLGMLFTRREVSCYEAATKPTSVKIDTTETVSGVTAGSFVVGRNYEIVTAGTTDFTAIGAADNNPGTRFVATGVGSGTGTADEQHFYAMGASQYVHAVQMHSVGYGMANSLQITCGDGFYASDCHWGFPTDALMDFLAVQANLPILNHKFANCFADDSTTLEAGSTQTDYGARFRDPSALGTNMVDINFVGGEVNGCEVAGFHLDVANLVLSVTGTEITNSGTDAVVIEDCTRADFIGTRMSNSSSASGRYMHIKGGDEIVLKGVTGRGGTALQGVLVDATFAGDMPNPDVSIFDATGAAFEDNSSAGIDWSGCWADKSNDLIEGVGTWTARVSDSSGNDSATTVTGRYRLHGPGNKLCTAYFHNLNDIDTTGLTAGDNLRISLPFTSASVNRQIGDIIIKNMASIGGSGRQMLARVPVSASYANLINAGDGTAGSTVQLVSNLSTGVTDIEDFSITYEIA